jgi:hypothetical protein
LSLAFGEPLNFDLKGGVSTGALKTAHLRMISKENLSLQADSRHKRFSRI